jgi:hypothetical protein
MEKYNKLGLLNFKWIEFNLLKREQKDYEVLVYANEINLCWRKAIFTIKWANMILRWMLFGGEK